MREEKHRTQEHRSDNYAPLRKARPRAIYHPMGRGGGRSGGLKGQGHGDRTDSLQGGVRSGTREAMVDPGFREAMAG